MTLIEELIKLDLSMQLIDLTHRDFVKGHIPHKV